MISDADQWVAAEENQKVEGQSKHEEWVADLGMSLELFGVSFNAECVAESHDVGHQSVHGSWEYCVESSRKDFTHFQF